MHPCQIAATCRSTSADCRSNPSSRPPAPPTWSWSSSTTWASVRPARTAARASMPTAERLADDGLRYSRFHVTALCSPDPPGADDRPQPPLGRHGRHLGDGHAAARLHRLPAGQRRHARADPARQRLQHRRVRQVAPDPAGGGDRVRAVHPLADGRGLRHVLRLHGRGDEPLVPAAVRRHHARRAGPAARGRLPPDRGPGRPRRRLGAHPAVADPGPAVLHLPRPRRHARAVPRRDRVDRAVRGPVRRRLGRAARGDPGPPEGARHRAGGRRAGPVGRRACRTGTSSTTTAQARRRRFMETYAGFAEHADQQVGRLVDALDELGVLDDTLFLYLLGDNGASGEGGLEGTVREHLVGHGIADDVADMDARLDEIGDPTTYAMYPVGLGAGDEHAVPVDQAGRLALRRHPRRPGRALARRHRVRAARSGTSSTTSSTCCRRSSTPPGCRCPRPSTAWRSSRSRAPSMRYSFDDADAEDRRTHAVLRDGRQPRDLPRGLDGGHPPRHSVEDGRGAAARSTTTSGSSTTPAPTGSRPTTSRQTTPSGSRELQALFDEEAEKHQVLPARRPGHRAREPRARRSPRPAPRPAPDGARSVAPAGSEEAAPNVKNRSHTDHGRPRHPGGPPAAVDQRRAGRPGRPLRRLVPLRRRRRPALRLQPLRQGPHRGARRARCCGRASTRWCWTSATTAGRPAAADWPRCVIDGVVVGPGVDRGDHGVLLRLRRDLQRRHRPRQPGRRRLPAGAQRLHRRDPPRRRRPRRGHRARRRDQRHSSPLAPTTELTL